MATCRPCRTVAVVGALDRDALLALCYTPGAGTAVAVVSGAPVGADSAFAAIGVIAVATVSIGGALLTNLAAGRARLRNAGVVNATIARVCTRFTQRSAGNAGSRVTLARTALRRVAARQPGSLTCGADAVRAGAGFTAIEIIRAWITDLPAEDAETFEAVFGTALRVFNTVGSGLPTGDAIAPIALIGNATRRPRVLARLTSLSAAGTRTPMTESGAALEITVAQLINLAAGPTDAVLTDAVAALEIAGALNTHIKAKHAETIAKAAAALRVFRARISVGLTWRGLSLNTGRRLGVTCEPPAALSIYRADLRVNALGPDRTLA